MQTMIFVLSFLFMLIGSITGQDEDECQKIGKAIACCRPPKDPRNSEELMRDAFGEPKEMHARYQNCLKDTKDEPKATSLEEALGPLECLAECALNGTKLMTSDFKVNKEILMKVVDNDPEWTEFLKKHMDICEQKVAKLESGSPKCKGNFVQFSACLIDEIANNCPLGGPLAGSPECQKRSVSLMKCNPLKMVNM